MLNYKKSLVGHDDGGSDLIENLIKLVFEVSDSNSCWSTDRWAKKRKKLFSGFQTLVINHHDDDDGDDGQLSLCNSFLNEI